MVAKDHDEYEADDNDSDVSSTSSQDTVILCPLEPGKCHLEKCYFIKNNNYCTYCMKNCLECEFTYS